MSQNKSHFLSLKPESRFEHELIQEYDHGECIFAEGDHDRDLYIIQNGSVVITKKTAGGEIRLAQFKKGDFFGDMALLQSLPRYAGAFAEGETTLLILKPAGFLLKIRRDPTFAFEMLQQLSHRVKVSNDRILELIRKYNLPSSEVQALLKEVEG